MGLIGHKLTPGCKTPDAGLLEQDSLLKGSEDRRMKRHR